MILAAEKATPYYPMIDILKGLTVLLVVLGHSSPLMMKGLAEGFGMSVMVTAIYSFHMAAFMGISGFLASRKVYGDTPVADELQKNAKRMLLPYVVYSLMMLVLKQFLGDYAVNRFTVSDAALIIAGVSPHGGMWFLWSNFVLSAIFLCVSRLRKSHALFLCLGALGFALYIAVFPFVEGSVWHTPLKGVLCFSLFYALGIVAGQYSALMERRGRAGLWLMAAVAAALIGGWAAWVVSGHVSPWVQAAAYLPMALLGIVGCVALAQLVAMRPQGFLYRLLREWGLYSYDIYLLSYFVIVAVRVVAHDILHMPYFVSVLSIVVLSMTLPYAASRFMLRRSPLLRKVFLGSWNR